MQLEPTDTTLIRWRWQPGAGGDDDAESRTLLPAKAAVSGQRLAASEASLEPQELIEWVHSGAVDTSPLAWTLEMLEPAAGPAKAVGWVIGEVRHGQRRLAAAYCLVLPGRSVMLVGPHVDPELWDSARTDAAQAAEGVCEAAGGVTVSEQEWSGGWAGATEAMLRGLIERCWCYGPELVQTVLAIDDTQTPALLLHAGLQPLAVLDQMWLDLPQCNAPARRDAGGNQPASNSSVATAAIPYTAKSHQRWVDLLQASYHETHDCPQLNKYRSAAASLEGYLAAVADKSFRWWRLHIEGEDAACMMLTEALPGHWELVYLGVTPNFRRRGLARQLLVWGVGQVEALGGASISLAVDQRNRPALSLYRSLGWRTLQSVAAWFAFPALPTVSAEPAVT